jgi:hypothetical protein
METDSLLQLDLEQKIEKWAALLPDCEEKLLSYFDLIRWRSERGDYEAMDKDFALMEAIVAALPKLPAGTMYLTLAKCHLAFSRRDKSLLRQAIDSAKSIHLDPMYFQDAFTAELIRFERLHSKF